MPSISCSCGVSKLVLCENRPLMSLYCACKDCTQAIKWGEINGGKPPQNLPQAVYIRSDITSVVGKKYLKAFQLRDPAKSTRVYCIKCYSIMGVDHPAYSNNVFMFWPKHCSANLDLSIKPCAVIYMSSYQHNNKPDIPSDIPVFYKFDYPQERNRFLDLPDVKNAFRPPSTPPVGETFKGIIDSLGEINNLNFEIGAEPMIPM